MQLEHFLMTLKQITQSYNSCITDCQHDFEKEKHLEKHLEKQLQFFFFHLEVLFYYNKNQIFHIYFFTVNIIITVDSCKRADHIVE